MPVLSNHSWNDGWLAGIKHCFSPNFDPRPADAEVELLVVHNISLPPEEYAGDSVEAFFCNALDCSRHPYFEQIRGLKVSAHFFIRRDGELVQFVSANSRAWHAGESEYQGRTRCNDFSIGVELEGSDHHDFTQRQYSMLVALTASMMTEYPALHADSIVGHSDIAPGRKTDPGECFDWALYRRLLKEALDRVV